MAVTGTKQEGLVLCFMHEHPKEKYYYCCGTCMKVLVPLDSYFFLYVCETIGTACFELEWKY